MKPTFLLLLLSICLSLHTEDRKVVLITGASRGIGWATAEYLAERGYTVYATMRTPIEPQSNLHVAELDVTDEATIQKAVTQIIENEGHIDVLINNAAYAIAGPLECLTLLEAQEEMDVNFFGVIRVCQAVIPHMRKQGSGHIINISSEQGVYGLPYGSLYTASKAALESLSEALSIELLPWNLHVSIVEPGMVATRFTLKLGSREVDGNPYEKIYTRLEESLTEERVPSSFCQTSEEVAHFLWGVIEDPNPKLRYQTSELARKHVSQFHADPTGETYLEWIKPLIDDYYSN